MEYGAFKQSRGRTTSFRDLTFSGKMWQSLSVAKINNGSRMFFAGTESSAKATGNNIRNDFFGISPDERELIRKEIKILTVL